MNTTRFALLGACFLMLSVDGCGRVRPDASAYAADANDATVIIEGCGSQPVVGYTYCRMPEGQDATALTLTLHSPPKIKCVTEPCVSFTIFYPDGTPSLSVPASLTGMTTLKWSELVKRGTFQVNDRGFWPVIMEWKYLDLDGVERSSIAEGEIRMRVLKRSYVPLHTATSSPEFAWNWTARGLTMGLATSGRAMAHK
jgi:hypothetical protein